MWIWQNKDWPNFTYDINSITPVLERCIQATAPLKQLALVLTQSQQLDWEAAILLDETLSSAKIEGEMFDRDSVRSSIVNKLGLVTENDVSLKNVVVQSDSMVELLLRAIRFKDKEMNHDVMKYWHLLLFPVKPLITPLTIGDYRNDKMQIISGRYGNQKTHYLAPGLSHTEVTDEMRKYFDWLNSSDVHSGYIRAAIAKFWFLSIHPFDDGNGRLSRVIAERCLAEAEQTDLRLFSISSVIDEYKSEYYQLLEELQRGSLNITEWIIWFLSKVEIAALNAKKDFERVVQATRFWQSHQQTQMNRRQNKLVIRLLETTDFSDGVSRKKYKALTKTSDATAVRDLKDLVEKQVLIKTGNARSRRYFIKRQKV